MTAVWRKAFRDFWQERARTFLVVLAIALGISGFETVLATYAVLTRELDRGYLATNPPSAILRTDAVDDDLLRAVLTGHGVSDAVARRAVAGRLQTGAGEWIGLRLFVVKDYANVRLGRLRREKGAWPPGPGEMLIERDAFQVAHAKIGDSVTVKTAAGIPRRLRVAGSVHDVGQAQARMENLVYGYITRETLMELGEGQDLDQLQILVARDRLDEGHIRAVAADVAKVLEDRGHPVRRIDVPKPGKHPHADIMGLLLLAIAAFGFSVLLLSGILVINLLAATIGSQVRQIGVMKTVGGTRARIAGVYFTQALFLGIAAVVIALPVGTAGSRLFCRSQALLLNFDIESFAIPLWVFALVAAVGIGVPLLAAAYPVWKGSGVSVREALSDFGVSRSSFGANRFDRTVAGLGGAARPILLAMRNTFRRRSRLVLTLATLGAGGLFFLSALNVRASMIATLERLFRGRKFDLTVGLGGMYPIEAVERAARATPGVRALEGWIATEASLVGSTRGIERVEGGGHSGAGGAAEHTSAVNRDENAGSDGFSVIALPPETPLLEWNLLEGRKLVRSDTNAAVVNNGLAAKDPSIRVGRVILLRVGPHASPWRVVGIAREPFAPPAAYVRRGYLDELLGFAGKTNNLRLVLERTDPASLRRVQETLERNLERAGVRQAGSRSTADSRFAFDQHMVMIYVALVVMSGIIGAVGALGLMTTMSLNVLERRREMGVLRAIGATPSAIWLIVVAEGSVIGLWSWAVAAAAAGPVSLALGNLLVQRLSGTGLDFKFEPIGLVVWLAVSILLGAVGSFLPAWRASRGTVREALAYE